MIEARGGSINAATGYERTSFQVRSLAGGLALGLEVIADLVLRPTLDRGDLAQEVGVIAQEIAEAADTPDDFVFELAQGAAFAGQPLGRPVLGTEASIARRRPGRAGGVARAALRAGPAGDQRRRRGRRGRARGARRAAVRGGGIDRRAVAVGRDLRRRPRRRGAAAGAGARGLLPAGRRRGRPRLLRHAHLRRSARRRHVEPALPGGARAARAWPTPSTPSPRATRRPASSASTPAARPRTPRGWPTWSRPRSSKLAGGHRRGRARPRQGAAEGRPLHGPRIAGCPRRAGRRAAARVRPATQPRGDRRRGRCGHARGDPARLASGCWRQS